MTTHSRKGTATTDTAPRRTEEEAPQSSVRGEWWRGSSDSGSSSRCSGWCLTSFKQEGDAATSPPTLFFTPTLDQFKAVFDQGIGPAMLNSVFATGMSTILVLLLGTPARVRVVAAPSHEDARTRCSSS